MPRDRSAPTKASTVAVRDLAAGYGRLRVVDGVTLEFPQHAVTLIVGRNGSGKSTLIKSMFGLARVFEGAVALDGIPITGAPVHERIARGIRYVPQTGGLFGGMTAEENLLLAAAAVPVGRIDLQRTYELFPALEGFRKKRAGELSGGQQRLLAFAMGTITKPSFLLVDEPSAGLAPALVHEVMQRLREVKEREQTGVVLVEQNVAEGCRIADYVYLLRDGRLHWQGDPNELLAQPSLAAFL